MSTHKKLNFFIALDCCACGGKGQSMSYWKSNAFFLKISDDAKLMLLIPCDDFCNFSFPYHCIFNKHSKNKHQEERNMKNVSVYPRSFEFCYPIKVLKQLLNQKYPKDGERTFCVVSLSISLFCCLFFSPFGWDNIFWCRGYGGQKYLRRKRWKNVNLETVYLFFLNVFNWSRFFSHFFKEKKARKQKGINFTVSCLKKSYLEAKIIRRCSIISLSQRLYRIAFPRVERKLFAFLSSSSTSTSTSSCYFSFFDAIWFKKCFVWN